MGFLIPSMLFLIAFNTSSTWATNNQPSLYKEFFCNQCQRSCKNTNTGNPGRVGPGGATGPRRAITMALIEQSMDRKIKEALQMFNVRICDGANLKSAVARNKSGGVFNSYIPAVGFKNVFCDLTDDGGNWTVFQRRMNGDVDFYRGWDEYVNGFGHLQGDHWLGLEALHQMTKEGNIELKIKMTRTTGMKWVARYSNFRVGPKSDKYRLHVSGYSGNAGDALSWHNNQQFSTKDSDHDVHSSWNCASYHEGAWWYKDCALCNLNGNFHKTAENKGIWWFDAISFKLLRYSEMKFRKRL